MNPFFIDYNTPFGTHPFSQIKLEHYLPAVQKGIEEAQAEIDKITTNKDQPTFKNTLEALENTGELLTKVTSVFFNLNSAETNPEMQALAQELSPILSAHSNDILLNKALFERVKTVYNANPTINPEQQMLLEKKYKGFVRNGALLKQEEKDKLREIDMELGKLSLTYGENVLKESNAFEMVLDSKEDLEGLPEGIIAAAAATAKQSNKTGWVFTLDYPSYIPFVTYSAKRALRKKMYDAFSSKANKNNENNNKSIITKLVNLKRERANLLGYQSHSHYTLEERMAKSPNQVFDFLNDLQAKSLPFAKTEFETLENYALELDGLKKIEKYDGAYYAEKLKKEKFEIDDELLRPYFKLEDVIDGVFKTAQLLFDLNFVKTDQIDTYHDDVVVYEVKDKQDKHVAVFYADFYPRAGKRQGAWMTSYRSQRIKDGTDQRPHVSIVCNFTKPTEEKPSLLTFNEVTTLFHEFGHALHGILANGTYGSLSGTSVYWDFVELPSQIMENWCYEKECLELFATHFQTGELIPEEYIKRIKDSANFMSGMATIRQLSFGKLDMAYHSLTTELTQDIKEFERNAISELDLYPEVEGSCLSTQFSHIFQGGYSSGYYSYKWAEVLDADAFEAFKEKGIFNKEIASSFKENILSAGGSEHPSILYKRFRGRDAKPDALLKRAGLVK